MSTSDERARVYAEAAAAEGMSVDDAIRFGVESVLGSQPAARDSDRVRDPFAPPMSGGGFLTLGAMVMRARGRKEAEWIIPRLLPVGVSLLAGPPKVGKSFMSLDIAFSVAAGGNALGTLPTNQAGVIYLALEDHDTRLVKRLESLEPDVSLWPLEALTLVTIDEADAGLRPLLDRWHTNTENPRLVILDTLGSYRTLMANLPESPARARMNAYDQDVQLLRPLQQWALERDVALLIVTHTNQTKWEKGDDWTTKVSGTSGLTGTADQVMLLRGERGANTAELLIVGREIQDAELSLTRVGPWWMFAG